MSIVNLKDLTEESSLLIIKGCCHKWMGILGAPLPDSTALSWYLLYRYLLFSAETAEKVFNQGLSGAIRVFWSTKVFLKDIISVFRVGEANVVTELEVQPRGRKKCHTYREAHSAILHTHLASSSHSQRVQLFPRCAGHPETSQMTLDAYVLDLLWRDVKKSQHWWSWGRRQMCLTHFLGWLFGHIRLH